jgi:hypothetical protein
MLVGGSDEKAAETKNSVSLVVDSKTENIELPIPLFQWLFIDDSKQELAPLQVTSGNLQLFRNLIDILNRFYSVEQTTENKSFPTNKKEMFNNPFVNNDQKRTPTEIKYFIDLIFPYRGTINIFPYKSDPEIDSKYDKYINNYIIEYTKPIKLPADDAKVQASEQKNVNVEEDLYFHILQKDSETINQTLPGYISSNPDRNITINKRDDPDKNIEINFNHTVEQKNKPEWAKFVDEKISEDQAWISNCTPRVEYNVFINYCKSRIGDETYDAKHLYTDMPMNPVDDEKKGIGEEEKRRRIIRRREIENVNRIVGSSLHVLQVFAAINNLFNASITSNSNLSGILELINILSQFGITRHLWLEHFIGMFIAFKLEEIEFDHSLSLEQKNEGFNRLLGNATTP